jgi:phosphotransferase system enzyme I (PtsP)
LAVAHARRYGELVLRATFGHPQSSVGAVRMRVGEGLTGFAVECLRPVSVARATSDARNKAFAGMDETRFPSLAAIPLVDGGRAVGALVIQRKEPRRFGQREIVLAASVAAPVLFALERARLREHRGHPASAPSLGASRPHGVVLKGSAAAPGAALGTVMVRRHAAQRVDRKELARGDVADERARLGAALAAAAEEVTELEAWALRNAPIDRATMMMLLSPARFVLDDARLRGRMVKQVEAGLAAEEAVERVMREYTRVLSSSGDSHLVERALEVEALCLRVMARVGAEEAGRPVSAGCVLVASRLTVCDALELGAGHGVAALLAGPAENSPGLAVACALGMPVVASVSELFRWAADGDRALIHGEDGTVILNPSSVDVANHRRR